MMRLTKQTKDLKDNQNISLNEWIVHTGTQVSELKKSIDYYKQNILKFRKSLKQEKKIIKTLD